MGKIAITERVTGHTELIGLIAYPIRHSMSPTMHNEAFKKLGLDYVYVCFQGHHGSNAIRTGPGEDTVVIDDGIAGTDNL